MQAAVKQSVENKSTETETFFKTFQKLFLLPLQLAFSCAVSLFLPSRLIYCCFSASGAGDAAQRRRRPRLQPLGLLPAAERRHPAGLLHHAAHRAVRAQNPAGPGILTRAAIHPVSVHGRNGRKPGGILEGAWRNPGGNLEGAWRNPGGSLEESRPGAAQPGSQVETVWSFFWVSFSMNTLIFSLNFICWVN